MYKDVPMSETATEVGSDSLQRPSNSQRKLLRVLPEKHLPKCEEKNWSVFAIKLSPELESP